MPSVQGPETPGASTHRHDLRAKVLLVAPDEEVANALAPALRERFCVLLSGSVAQAVAMAEDVDHRPHAAVIDFTATTIAAGTRLARLLNWRRTPRTPVIALHRGSDVEKITRSVGVEALVQIPVEPEEMVRQVIALIDR